MKCFFLGLPPRIELNPEASCVLCQKTRESTFVAAEAVNRALSPPESVWEISYGTCHCGDGFIGSGALWNPSGIS